MQSLTGLAKVMRENLRACGYPIVLSRPFDKRTPSHQCGTVRMGNDPATAPLDPCCRAFDHRNLFVVDGGFLPTSAAVNPALSIAAQALRVADHIRSDGSRADEPARRHRHRRQPRHRPGDRAKPGRGRLRHRRDRRSAGPTTRPRSKPRCARRGADVLFHEGDIGDLDSHAPLVDAVARALRPDRLPGQQCRHRLAGARRPARSRAGEFRPGDVGQSARHRLPDPGGGEGDAGGTPTTEPRTIVNITSVSAEMASPERADYCISKAGLSMWTKAAGAAARRRGHLGVRGPARASSAPT